MQQIESPSPQRLVRRSTALSTASAANLHHRLDGERESLLKDDGKSEVAPGDDGLDMVAARDTDAPVAAINTESVANSDADVMAAGSLLLLRDHVKKRRR